MSSESNSLPIAMDCKSGRIHDVLDDGHSPRTAVLRWLQDIRSLASDEEDDGALAERTLVLLREGLLAEFAADPDKWFGPLGTCHADGIEDEDKYDSDEESDVDANDYKDCEDNSEVDDYEEREDTYEGDHEESENLDEDCYEDCEDLDDEGDYEDCEDEFLDADDEEDELNCDETKAVQIEPRFVPLPPPLTILIRFLPPTQPPASPPTSDDVEYAEDEYYAPGDNSISLPRFLPAHADEPTLPQITLPKLPPVPLRWLPPGDDLEEDEGHRAEPTRSLPHPGSAPSLGREA